MRMFINIVTLFAVAIIVAACAFVLYGRDRTWTAITGPADLGALDLTRVERTTKPHDALFCSAGLCDGIAIDKMVPTYNAAPAALISAIDATVSALGDNVERVDDRSDTAKARYVTRSNIMRFPDTVWLQAVTMDDGSTGLIAYARAQLGYSDLGANKARLDSWLAQSDLD